VAKLRETKMRNENEVDEQTRSDLKQYLIAMLTGQHTNGHGDVLYFAVLSGVIWPRERSKEAVRR
jgi:hypothetical protein